jgi:hypothetical protein
MSLYVNGLNGTIPDSIGEMTGMTYLALQSNSLHGTIPDSIGQMTSMAYLALFNNKLTGTIPSALANLKLLTDLKLADNKLGGEVPPLPFAQYTSACYLNDPSQCAEFGACNHFSCPLPANSDKCKADKAGSVAGVNCH